MSLQQDLSESAAKSFLSTLKEVGTDKAVGEALIGGAAGVGTNLAYNTVSGDSGGYTGAALMGGAAGGLGRAGLKHFNLEGQASKLYSTFKQGAVGKYSSNANKSSEPAGQKLMFGKNEASNKEYQNVMRNETERGNRFRDDGMPAQAQEHYDRSAAYGTRLKENQISQYKQYSRDNAPGELEDIYKTQGGANYIKQNLDPNFKSVSDRLKENTDAVSGYRSREKQKGLDSIKSMGVPDTPRLGYDPVIPQGYAGDTPPTTVKKDYKDVTNSSKLQNGYNLSRPQNQSERSILKKEDKNTGQFSFALGSTGKNKAPVLASGSSPQQSLDFGNQLSFDFDAPEKRVVTGDDMNRKKKNKNRKRKRNN